MERRLKKCVSRERKINTTRVIWVLQNIEILYREETSFATIHFDYHTIRILRLFNCAAKLRAK